MRAPMVVRWPGHIVNCTMIKDDIFASLDWLPTLVEIAGGAKGNDLKAQIEKGAYPGIVKTTLDGVNQIRLSPTGKSPTSRRVNTFFYYSARTRRRSAYKNWKIYFTMVPQAPEGRFDRGCASPIHWAQVAQHQARSLRDLSG